MIHDCRQCAGSRYVLVRTKGQATSLISPQEPFLGCSYNKKSRVLPVGVHCIREKSFL